MELNLEIYSKMSAIGWFRRCGQELADGLPFIVQRLADVEMAITSACSSAWQDAGTAAQGQLTGYLAKHHYDSYGGYWNRLARASCERLEAEVMPRITEALDRIAAVALSGVVLLDLNRIAIQSAYAKRFKRIPDFYERLLVVYERGHLPCGWIGDLDLWPEGQLVVY